MTSAKGKPTQRSKYSTHKRSSHPSDDRQMELSDVTPPPPPAKGGRKRVRRSRSRATNHMPLFNQRSIEMTAAGAPVISATQAYLKHPDWSEYEENRLHFHRSFGKGRHIEFYILNKQKHQPGFITSFAESEILRLYGIHAARLHAVFATYAVQQKEPWKEPFTLFGSDLIKILRIHTGNKLKKADKLKAIADLAWVLGTLGAKIQWQEGALDLTIVERSLIWIVNVKEQYQNDLNGKLGELIEVEIEVQAGQWTRNFLNREGEKQRSALYQYGFINQDIFSIDPYKKELSAALALYLIQNRRSHPSGRYRIQTLLEAVISSQEIELIQKDKLKRSRLVKRFYGLLEDLININFTIEFDDQFPADLRPIWAEELVDDTTHETAIVALEQRLPDGFFSQWLQGIVIITPPAPIEQEISTLEAKVAESQAQNSEHSPEISRREPERLEPGAADEPITVSATVVDETGMDDCFEEPDPGPPPFTGTDVRELRQAAGMSQMELAIAMGMSQSWVRNLENKWLDRAIKPIYVEQLKKILTGDRPS